MSRLSNFFGRTNAIPYQHDAGVAPATVYPSVGDGSGTRGLFAGLPASVNSGHRVGRPVEEAGASGLSISLFKQDLKRWKRGAPSGEASRRREAVKRIEKTLAQGETSLKLNSLQLTNLPPLPSWLTQLDVSRNCLTGIQGLPAHLEILNLTNNRLTSLPQLPSWLNRLDVSQNCLTDIQGLPAGLTMLNLSNNRLTALPPLPPGLTELRAAGNQLSTLPPFPASLKSVSLSCNQLTDLPELPAELLRLWAVNNRLSSLPELPASLIELYLDGNALTSVPKMPARSRRVQASSDPLVRESEVEHVSAPHDNLHRKARYRLEVVTASVESPDAHPGMQLPIVATVEQPIEPIVTEADLFNEQLLQWEREAPVGEETARRQAVRIIQNVVTSGETVLELDRMGLTSLPSLPTGITTLRVRENRLASLPALPSGLTDLRVAHNRLSHLPELPSGLKALSASFNQLATLPTLPPGLRTLSARANQLDSLPDLPVPLKQLFVQENRLTSLPDLPPCLVQLRASSNQLREIDVLPPTLIELSVGSNRISYLYCSMALRLTTLKADDNRLDSLPCLSRRLEHLSICNNNLSGRPSFPSGLKQLYIRGNNFAEIPVEIIETSHDSSGCASAVLSWQRNRIWAEINAVAQERMRSERLEAAQAAAQRELEQAAAQRELEQAAAQRELERVAAQRELQPATVQPSPRTNIDETAFPSAENDGTPMRDDELAEAIYVQSLYDAGERPTYGQPPVIALPAASQRWAFPETEEGAGAFNAFQARLSGIAEYRNPATHENLTARIDGLVAAMKESADLRAACFNIAEGASATCGDRVTLALNDMEMAHINHDAETGKYSMPELFALGDGFFKLQILDEVAVQKIAEFNLADQYVDEIEVRLAYQTDLAQRLNLPGVARAMIFRGCARLTKEDIDAAEETVLRQLGRGKSIDFMVQWQPWRQALERAHPDEYERVRVYNQPEREAIVCQPPRMNEQEWREAFDSQAAAEASQIAVTSRRLTRAFMEEHGLE